MISSFMQAGNTNAGPDHACLKLVAFLFKYSDAKRTINKQDYHLPLKSIV